jgi:hypothetical protein
MRLDCRSTTSDATGVGAGDSAMTISHAREELNEATRATKNYTRSSSFVDNDFFFSDMSRWWSTSKAIVN